MGDGFSRRAHRRAALAVTMVVVATFAACGGNDDPAEPTASAPAAPAEAGQAASEPLHVKVATIPVDTAAQAFFADAEGFFRDVGLDVEIEIAQDPTQLAAAVLSGDAQVALTSVAGLALLHARDAGAVMVATGALYRPSAPTTALVARAGVQIDGPQDLIGKSVAIDQRNSTTDVALRRWLDDAGVDIAQVTIREMPFATMLGPLKSGDVDAAIVPEPFLTLAGAQGATVVTNIFDVVCEDDCLLTAWFSKGEWAAENQDALKAFQEAIAKASTWANDPANHARSGEILAQYAPLTPDVIARMERAFYGTELQPELAQPWVDAMAETAVIPAGFEASELAG